MSINYLTKNVSSQAKFSKEKKQFLNGIFAVVTFLLVGTNLQAQTTFTSVQSGNFTDPDTWGTATAPTPTDHIIIAAGTTVLLNDLITITNATISGTLEGSNDSPDFTVTGNLIVNSGGLIDGIYYYDAGGWGYDKAIQLNVAGNITNNGRIDLSIGSSYTPEGALNLNGSTVQTISGLGTFGGTLYLTDNSNNGAVINQLLINNTSTATPNIIWGFNNIKIRSVLSMVNARVDLGTNKMTIGNYGSANTNCATGSGFLTGTVGRWYSAYDTFAPISSGVDYYNSNAIFPFINANGKSRAAFITRPVDNISSAVSGELTVSYYDDSTVASGFSIADGGYTVTNIYESAWIVSKDANYAFPIGNHTLAFSAQDAYLIMNGNSRIIKADGTTVGNHQNGTITPFAARVGLSDSDLNNTFQVGYNAALDTPITSVQSGNWNDITTWSSNSIPTCGNTVTILSGHTITANSPLSVGGINILAGATLTSDSSTLTIGCTNNNATFYNGGTYNINSGTLTVNGNVLHANGSTFNQTGGEIIVDGNHNGAAATSTDQTLFKIGNSTLNLSAGKITLIDPPVANTALATTHTVTSIVACTGWFCWFPTNIFLDAVDGVAVGQIVVGTGVPAGTVVASVNFDGSINTNPSLPETGLSLPLNLSFYNVISSPSAFVYDSANNYAAGANHTLQIGDGISTEKGTVTTSGFNCSFRAAEGTISVNNLIVNAPDATNRFVNLDSSNPSGTSIMNVQNDFTIIQGKVKGQGVDTYFGGNIINNGALNLYNNTYFGNYIDGNSVATDKAQTISGTGTFNAQVDTILNTPSNTGSVSQLRVNNTSVEGVTFMVPFNVVSSLTMTAGIIHTSATSVLTVGTPAMSYTASLTGNFGETCYIDGPFAKDIGGGQNAIDLTNGSGFIDKFFFPVGKSTYAPIWVAVTTPAGGFGSPGAKIKAEAFETNSGIPSSNIAYLSQNRWEVSKTAGDVTEFNIKVADANAIESSIIVQAPTAAGIYDNDFGITATFEAGTPNMLTSTSAPLPFADFNGYFSTARQSECTTINPGNTLASETNICGGKSVNLSLQNVVVGEGISYQWQSSTNGTDYTDINMATATTASVAPFENTYYRCNVTCSFSTTTVASTPIQITLNNTITSTTPATICQPADTAVLSATSVSGDVKWYATQVGGSALATGNSFTTPAITTTTTYYAGTETTIAGTAGLVYTLDGYSSGSTNRGLAFNLSNSIILNSVKVYPQQNPGGSGPLPITIKVLQNGIQVPGTTEVTFTPNTFSDWSPTTVAQTVTLNYTLSAGDNYSLEITDGATYDNALAYVSPFPSPFPVTNGAVSIIGGINNGFVDTYSYYYFFNWDITEVCSSARVAVVATVQTADDCGLGTAPNSSLSRVVAYPNPYSQTFKLDIQTNNTADVVIKVYDMIGRLIENQTVGYNDLSQLEIGNGYPSGIYNVSITQEGKAKTLRVIKR
ncbi:T9SS type A sorting domain-containing protein [Flavobacterium sp. IMCC34852]|uniref:T9SS type A sorting domain-containing protein n=1 Tax=Flavobacterium rivulicola TaxID=2732161 RepID=A0A7Y3RAZ4_9FLAO|nr:T9SS type A sorting domain-containing protein [Flavobacterium sp. IMCC34852]NNT72607.1 T9SS type A sorting domain-containing protein [Flavobacterium sp. IMCC34852]